MHLPHCGLQPGCTSEPAFWTLCREVLANSLPECRVARCHEIAPWHLPLSFKVPWGCFCTLHPEEGHRKGCVGLPEAAWFRGWWPASLSLVFGPQVESDRDQKEVFLSAEGQHFVYVFFWKNIQDGMCFITLCCLTVEILTRSR
jgi:hypothetical protein